MDYKKMSKSSNSKGITLIELVVAMFIVGIVSIAIFTAFKSQQRSYLIQDQVAEMQQNLRAAMLMTSRDVRMAGFGFGGYVNSIETFNNNPDRVDLIYADAGVTTSISDTMTSPSSIFKVDSTAGFQDGDLIIITDGTSGTLMQITHVSSSASTLQHNPSSVVNPPGGHNTFPSPDGYGKGSKIYKLKYVSYDVDSTDPDHPTMRVDPDGPLGAGAYQPLADNIEDLQVVIIFVNGNEANTYDDTDGDLTNDYDDIRSIRISILARTDRPDPDFNDGQRPAIEDHAGGAPDHYRRRLLSTLIKVRNLGL
ncbi:MAG: PilW family protein [Deltaproteobacteria bacterium]|nr:PilW family protein [Deltaproteobacteria bacterium]